MLSTNFILYAQETNRLNPDAAPVLKQYMDIYTGGNNTPGITGMGNFSLASMIAWIIFGGIGFVAFIYGKKMSNWRPLVIGILLMGYPYFVSNLVILYLVGALLTGALFIFRE